MMGMSQKVRILKVRHEGCSVFLGVDSYGNRMWTRNPDRIMDWLCDGWRSRYNQHRAHRPTRRLVEDVATHERMWVDVPLGGADVKPSVRDSQARLHCLWLACIPSPILSSCERVENTGWFAGLKRKKTSGGRVPGFRSRHKTPQFFVCWRNQTKTGNALYHRTGKRTGVVVITGSVPKQYRRQNESEARWRVNIHIRVSQPIREYTSVAVNWTDRTLVFTNSPLPIDRTGTGEMVGLDRGCVHTVATSDNAFLDMPQPSRKEVDEYKRLQRKLARQDRTNEKRGGRNAKFASKSRAQTLHSMRRIQRRVNNRKHDWIAKTTTMLVREYDFIAMERLNVKAMSRRVQPKPDPNNPGHYLHNGRKAKSGLNRSILANRWTDILHELDYKTKLAGTRLVQVSAYDTSRICNVCGYCDKDNRESQAVFHCRKCGHEANADVNAAKNILDRALKLEGMDNAYEWRQHASTPVKTGGKQCR